MARDYIEGFWKWAKVNHPEIVREWYLEMQDALKGMEQEIKELEK